MAKKGKPRSLKGIFNELDELWTRLGDMNQKLDYIIKNLPKDRNGRNHK